MNDRARDTERLGELESAVLDTLWNRGESSVQQVRRALEPERELAYTTVMTVMARLADKGLLQRRKEGRAYVYRPSRSRDSVTSTILRGLVRRLYGGSSGRAIAQLLEADEEIADAELERLERMIRERRSEGSPGGSSP